MEFLTPYMEFLFTGTSKYPPVQSDFTIEFKLRRTRILAVILSNWVWLMEHELNGPVSKCLVY